MSDIELIDLIREHLIHSGFEIQPRAGHDNELVLNPANSSNRWRFKCDGRALTVSPDDALVIIKIDGKVYSSESFDMADPEAMLNLDNLLGAIKKVDLAAKG